MSNTRVACSSETASALARLAFASRTVPRQASQPPPANTSNGSRTDATTSPHKAHGAPALPLLSLIPDAVSPMSRSRCRSD